MRTHRQNKLAGKPRADAESSVALHRKTKANRIVGFILVCFGIGLYVFWLATDSSREVGGAWGATAISSFVLLWAMFTGTSHYGSDLTQSRRRLRAKLLLAGFGVIVLMVLITTVRQYLM